MLKWIVSGAMLFSTLVLLACLRVSGKAEEAAAKYREEHHGDL